jgi:CRP-like cAMP-binding protein
VTITADLFKRRFPRLLEKLGHSDLEILLKALTRIDASSGELLYGCGEHSDALYMIWEGRLAFGVLIAGKDIFLGHIGPGQFCGVTAVIEPGPALITATVAEPSVLLRLKHEELVVLRETQPRLCSNLLRALSLDLVEWLRAYEAYMAERTQLGNIQDFFRMSRHLARLEE